MKRTDIHFAHDDSHAFLPWVVGIMVCMAAMLLCLGVTLGGWITDRSTTYATSFTVNVPAGSDDGHFSKVYDLLRATPGVTGVARIDEDKLRDMLKPWLGGGEESADLPLPAVFDVTTDGKSIMNHENIQARLDSIAPGTEVDAHERWVASFSAFSAYMQGLIAIMATLILGGLALMIAFTSSASLKLHARTVNLLHSIGAEDWYITRQFQIDAFMLTLRGAIPGCAIAGLAYWGAGMYMVTLQSSVIPSLAMGLRHVALLLLMPLACAVVAWGTARVSVIRQLQHTL